MRKRDELADPESTWNRASQDEPLFVIRAKDKLSASMVRQWAEAAAMTGAHESEKIEEARDLAWKMETWRKENTE
jgi:hypothetical protein